MNAKTLIAAAALIAMSSSAFALGWTQSQHAGHCGALQFAMNDMHKARMAANFATNKGEMQVAANNWIELLKTDKRKAVERGMLACGALGIR